MTDRERLIELLKAADEDSARRCITDNNEAIADNADYLLANGVIVPPCKVGDTVWMPWEWNGAKGIACLKVTNILNIFGWNIGTDFDTDDEGYADKYKCGRFEFTDFGKTVFLTREEAEKALRKE